MIVIGKAITWLMTVASLDNKKRAADILSTL
jgi:hypothetical protein